MQASMFAQASRFIFRQTKFVLICIADIMVNCYFVLSTNIA